ncbi:MAG TPA: sulfite exporter TauE/SafE family protein [Gammaproteobacteria bacterium]|nr:sulfite exporter TauE/SafE family protein [Gammaproteobacteria bacterium]
MISLLQFDGPVLIAVVCVILFAGLVHGTLGLGFPMVATPILATMMDVRSAILLTLLPTMAVNIASIINSRESLASTRPFIPLVGFTLLGSIAGSAVLAITDPAPFRILLASLILLYLWSSLRISRQWLDDHAMIAMAGFGIAAGLAAGTTNVMVAVLIIYFLSLDTARTTMVPTLNACFLVGKASQILVLSIAGLVGLGLIIETAPLAFAAIIALLFGQRLRARIDVATYQSILRKLLLVLAAILIFQFLNEAGLIPWTIARSD